MQNADPCKRENVLQAFISVEAVAAICCMAFFAFTIPSFDSESASTSPEKTTPQYNPNSDVVKQAEQLPPWRLADDNQLEAASKAATDLVHKKSHDMLANLCAGNVYVIVGAGDEGLKCLKKAVALSHRNKFALENYAQRLAQLNHTDDAIIQYQSVIKADPRWEQPHLELAKLYFDQNLPAECAAELAAVTEINDKNFAARKLRGIALARANQLKPGLDEYVLAIEQENQSAMPETVKAMLGTAGVGAVDRVVYELQQQVTNRPDEYVPKLRLAQLDSYIGNPKEAKELLMDARRLAPNNAEVQRTLAVVLKQLGEENQAISAFGLSVKLEMTAEKDKQAAAHPPTTTNPQ